jgi:hypothetical protein
MRLFELRREPHKNVRQSTRDLLLKYADVEGTTVSFSPINKIGVHPKSNWDTPNGVYAYQIDEFKSAIERAKPHLVTSVFPFGETRPYIFILQSTYNNPLVLSNEINASLFNEQLKQVLKMTNLRESVVNLIVTNAGENSGTNSQELYTIVRQLCSREYGRTSATNIMNKMLRRLGYDAVIDNGSGVLYDSSEPIQIVYLTPKAYKILKSFHNDTLERWERHEYFGRDGRAQKPSIKVGDLVVITAGDNEYDMGKVVSLSPENKTAKVNLQDSGKTVDEKLSNMQLATI